jgi:peptide/nickel transport system substrate-binding protein
MNKKTVSTILGVIMALVLAVGPALAKDKDTLVVVQEAEPVGLDIMQSSIQTTMSVAYNIHDTILKPMEDATVKPGLVEKWEKLDDLTWKFTLVKGATFHNGEPINAAAVKFSFERIMSDALKSPHKGKLSSFKEVKVMDERTFTISMLQPYAPGLYMLAQYLFVVPPMYVAKVGDVEYNLNPVGSGPYKLDKWVKGQEILLSAYDKYYGPKPAYKKLVFKGVPEEASRIASLMTGEADVISGVPVHQRQKIVDSGKAYLTDQMGSMNYLGLNTYEKPFSDVRVRQAINHAINRPLINKALFKDKAILCAGPISPRTFGADPGLKPYAYDPVKAKQLLTEAGYPNGFETRLAFGTYVGLPDPLAFSGDSDWVRTRWRAEPSGAAAPLAAWERAAILVPLALLEPAAAFDDLLARGGYRKTTPKQIRAQIARGAKSFVARHPEPAARVRALMGRVRPLAMGNVPLRDVAAWVEEATR